MLDILNYLNTEKSKETFVFGTYEFEYMREKMIDKLFGNALNKEELFPQTEWKIGKDKANVKKPLRPDTIMEYEGKYYVLDAKYYKFGLKGHSYVDHLPNSSSIYKQIAYGKYIFDLNKEPNMDCDSYNAFLMPFNKCDNDLNINNDDIAYIGEAYSKVDYDDKLKHTKVQGIVIDTEFLMSNYRTSNKNKYIKELAETIEKSYKCNHPNEN